MFVSLVSHYNRFFRTKVLENWSQITEFTRVWVHRRPRHLNVVLETAPEESVGVGPDCRGRRREKVCVSLVHSTLEHPALDLQGNRGEPMDPVDPILKVVRPLTEHLDIICKHIS